MCRNLHLCFCAQCRFVISAFGKIFALQICAFCAQTVFAHLHICQICARQVFHKLHMCRKSFSQVAHLSEKFLHVCAFVNSLFLRFHTNFQNFAKSVKFRKKTKKLEMSNSVPSVFDVFPKMSEKSSRVPEWYTSGSWANAFDNTGWQKSPEYALIRIAAGAPDLAKSPNPPPDGPGRPRKSRHFSLRTEKLPDSAPGLAFAPQAEILSGAVFPDPRTTRPSRQTDSEARRVLRQSPTHSANVRTLRKTLAEIPRQGQRHLHTVHTVHNRNRHTCTNCAHRNTDVHTCAHRATTPDTSGREHIVHVLLLLGKVGGAERPRAILLFLIYTLICKETIGTV